jgi:hypothetical protein
MKMLKKKIKARRNTITRQEAIMRIKKVYNNNKLLSHLHVELCLDL